MRVSILTLLTQKDNLDQALFGFSSAGLLNCWVSEKKILYHVHSGRTHMDQSFKLSRFLSGTNDRARSAKLNTSPHENGEWQDLVATRVRAVSGRASNKQECSNVSQVSDSTLSFAVTLNPHLHSM